MTRVRHHRNESLVRTITLRLAAASLVAMLLQVTIVVARTYLHEDELNRSYVSREAQRLARVVRSASAGKAIRMGAVPSHYSGVDSGAYAFRVLRDDGTIVAERNAGKLSDLSPWRAKPSRTQDFWLLDLDTEKKLFVAGGLRQKVNGQEIWVEVATIGDPDAVYLGIVAAEVLDDVWIPMIPLILLISGVAVISIRRALGGLVAAASQAQLMSPLDNARRFDVTGMPKEAASLALAINGLLDRVAHLVRAQRMFIARAAHELRTPLAVMMLELGRSDDPRVRRLEDDVRSMGETVDRLLTLARLESIEHPERSEIDTGRLATEVVERLRDWAARDGHELALEIEEPASIVGDVMAVREAIRNLVDNAVKHTPSGTRVRVQVGPKGRILVEDSGPGLGQLKLSELTQPFKKGQESSEGAGLGLSIVRQAVDLHHGLMTVGESPLGGARFTLTFPSGAQHDVVAKAHEPSKIAAE